MKQNYNNPTFIVDTTGVDITSETLFKRATQTQFFKQYPTPKAAFVFLTHGFNVLTVDRTEGNYYSLTNPENVSYRSSESGTFIRFTLPLGLGQSLLVTCEYDSNGKPVTEGEGGGGGLI